MGIRRKLSSSLDRVLGPDRTAGLRRMEARTRTRLIDLLDVEGARPVRRPAARPRKASPRPRLTRDELIAAHGRLSPEGVSHAKPGSLPWAAHDPFADFPAPTGSGLSVLQGLHERLRPRTYVEIGVSRGRSLGLSRTRSIGVDPDFRITWPISCDVRIVKETSDDFFARPDAFDHFAGVPVDLGFIDGMHLAEFALRDFMHLERHMSRAGVIVLDDMLPRNSLEAYRIRRTKAWTGDVYKLHEVLTTYRPDLTIIPVNARLTGSYLVVGLDPDSTVLEEHYDEIEARIATPDPQVVPQDWLERRTAVDAATLLGLDVWEKLAAARDPEPSPGALAPLWAELAALPRVGG